MNHLSPRFAPPVPPHADAPAAAPAAAANGVIAVAPALSASARPPAAITASRHVRHAILDVRAGLPVLIAPADATAPSLIALAAETATEAGLAAVQRAAAGQKLLILAASRGQAVTGTPQTHGLTALQLPPGQLTQAALLALADPTQPQTAPPVALAQAGPLAATALRLAKLGHLLPAMLVAEAPPGTPLTTVTAADILTYQAEATTTLARVAEAAVPLAEAEHARLVAYRPADGGPEHLALLIGQPEQADAPLVRIHSECFTGDLLGSLRCDCGPQLHQAIRRMAAEGAGVLLYMAQEGRGIGLVNKLRAYALQDRGLDTLDANRALGWAADERDFAAAALMLRDLGITRVRLLTNNPDKVAALDAAGITVAGRLRHAIAANGVNDGYLETKARRFGHLLG
jgi:GTP cyclohydrolase II